MFWLMLNHDHAHVCGHNQKLVLDVRVLLVWQFQEMFKISTFLKYEYMHIVLLGDLYTGVVMTQHTRLHMQSLVHIKAIKAVAVNVLYLFHEYVNTAGSLLWTWCSKTVLHLQSN